MARRCRQTRRITAFLADECTAPPIGRRAPVLPVLCAELQKRISWCRWLRVTWLARGRGDAGQARGQARLARAIPIAVRKAAADSEALDRAPSCGDDHGVQIPWQPQDCTRTCARCGSSWKVPGSARGWWRGRLASRSLARCVVIAGLLVGANQENMDEHGRVDLGADPPGRVTRPLSRMPCGSVHAACIGRRAALLIDRSGVSRVCVRIRRTRRRPGDISCRGLRRSRICHQRTLRARTAV